MMRSGHVRSGTWRRSSSLPAEGSPPNTLTPTQSLPKIIMANLGERGEGGGGGGRGGARGFLMAEKRVGGWVSFLPSAHRVEGHVLPKGAAKE